MPRSSPETPPPTPPQPDEAPWAATMDRLRQRTRPHTTLRICDDEQLRKAAEQAEQEAEQAKFIAQASPGDELLVRRAEEADAARTAAATALEQAAVVLTFCALPRHVLEELITAHPPTDAQTEEGAAFNPDTFPAALISVASKDGMSEDEAGELLTTWSAPDANSLWEAAWQVQQESRADVGKG